MTPAEKLQNLVNTLNGVTGESDDNISDAIESLLRFCSSAENEATIPANIESLDVGTFDLETDTAPPIEIQHKLGAVPDLVFCWSPDAWSNISDISNRMGAIGWVYAKNTFFNPNSTQTALITKATSQAFVNVQSSLESDAIPPNDTYFTITKYGAHKLLGGNKYLWIAVKFGNGSSGRQLPTGIAKLKSGKISPTSDTNLPYEVNHGLGEKPDLVFCWSSDAGSVLQNFSSLTDVALGFIYASGIPFVGGANNTAQIYKKSNSVNAAVMSGETAEYSIEPDSNKFTFIKLFGAKLRSPATYDWIAVKFEENAGTGIAQSWIDHLYAKIGGGF